MLGSPCGRREGMHLRGGRGRESADHVGKVGFRVDPAAPCGGDDRVEDGAVVSSFAGAEKQEVLFADGGAPDLVLDKIVVDFDPAVVQVLEERARWP